MIAERERDFRRHDREKEKNGILNHDFSVDVGVVAAVKQPSG